MLVRTHFDSHRCLWRHIGISEGEGAAGGTIGRALMACIIPLDTDLTQHIQCRLVIKITFKVVCFVSVFHFSSIFPRYRGTKSKSLSFHELVQFVTHGAMPIIGAKPCSSGMSYSLWLLHDVAHCSPWQKMSVICSGGFCACICNDWVSFVGGRFYENFAH